MTCDLANPIFTDEAKATAHIESLAEWRGRVSTLRFLQRPQDGW
jgi:hypothetical protein